MILRHQNNHNTENRRRFAALFMALVVLLFLLLSTYFIAHMACHECSGDDCPICAFIQMSEDNLRQLGSGAPAATAAVSLVLLIMVLQIHFEYSIIISTPVSRKTRLNH